jgi:Zn-dependent peptidase ImmA (M78 family)
MTDHFSPEIASTLGSKLKSARLTMGLSPRNVADRISERFSITHATISNYESGRTTPSLSVLSVLASFYDRPLNWFLESGPSLANVHYRHLKSRTRISELRRYEANAQRWLEAYSRLEAWLADPLVNKHTGFESAHSDSGRRLAESLRERLKLNDTEPIRSVAELLEDFAVRAIELPTDLAIDGMAANYGNHYVIVLNPKVPNERFRMNAAHELGHVLLEDCAGECGHENTVVERRAYEFAAHLLIPEKQLESAFVGQSMVKLVKYKEYFGISLQAMIYRAEQSEIISKTTAKWLWTEFAKRGWRKAEPGFVRPDRATRFEDLLASAVAENRLNWANAAKLMRVPEDEIHQRLRLALGSDYDPEHEGGEQRSGEDGLRLYR